MDEADRDRTEALLRYLVGEEFQRRLVQRLQFLALGVHAALDREAILARNQRLRQADAEIVLLEPVLGPHLDDVAKAFRRHEGGARAPALDQRIGRKRRAVDDQVELARGNAGLGCDDLDAVEDGLLGLRIGRQHLRRVDRATHIQDDVREGPADIGAEPDLG